MEYRINFSSRTSADELAEVLEERFGVEASETHVGSQSEREDHTAPPLMVGIWPGGVNSRFACRLRGGSALAERVGHLHPTELAAVLCVGLQAQAVVSGGGRTGWWLVTADGHVAEVVVDDDLIDDEGIVIVAALAPIPTMPHIPVRTSTWCDERLLRPER